ncbi:MAG TPA: type II toxin-antitoxin system RelE/ParE family toxin [Longimicrobium sp.]|nr:type II toxin-antitoxin system RelE/ParE family toxin [Longimicrobium sp.]
MPRAPEYAGLKFTIQAMELADGSSPVGEFLDGLDARDRRKLDVLFEMLGELGRISNDTKFKKLSDREEIWEFKSFQVRIYCFFTPDRHVMLAHAVIKKQDRHNRADLEKAEERRRWFFDQKGWKR